MQGISKPLSRERALLRQRRNCPASWNRFARDVIRDRRLAGCGVRAIGASRVWLDAELHAMVVDRSKCGEFQGNLTHLRQYNAYFLLWSASFRHALEVGTVWTEAADAVRPAEAGAGGRPLFDWLATHPESRDFDSHHGLPPWSGVSEPLWRTLLLLPSGVCP
jgi:hypothetical protein